MPERELPAAAGWSFQQLVKRALQGEPVAYIRGQQEFWSLLLEVSPAVLIPRPETELVVERALAHLDPGAQRESPISARAAARSRWRSRRERPSARVTAVDASKEALERGEPQRGPTQHRERAVSTWSVGSTPLAGRRFDV